jgi:hypothetical protein
MNDASLVRVRQRVSHLARITQCRVERDAAACQHRVQRLAGDVFHGAVWLAAGLADFVNAADVRVVEAGGRPAYFVRDRAATFATWSMTRSRLPLQIFPICSSVYPRRTSSSVTLNVSLASFHPSTPPPPSKSDEIPT